MFFLLIVIHGIDLSIRVSLGAGREFRDCGQDLTLRIRGLEGMMVDLIKVEADIHVL